MKAFGVRFSVYRLAWFVFCWFATGAAMAGGSSVVRFENKLMRLDLDDRGRVVRMAAADGTECLHPERETVLLRLKRYSEENLKVPKRLRKLGKKGNVTLLELTYDDETALTLRVAEEAGWFRFEVVKATGIDDVDAIRWGPFCSTLDRGVGEYFGLLFGEDRTLGLTTLEPNTDGECIRTDGTINLRTSFPVSAHWLPYPERGTCALLDSIDHTRRRKTGEPFRYSEPLPGATVVGSKVALWLSPRGRELELLERLVDKEGLPKPVFGGVWVKRLRAAFPPSVWSYYTESSVDDVIEFCCDIGGENVCPFGDMFGNWGHFDLSPKLWPGGWPAVRKVSGKCAARGIKNTMYTLTDFLKPKEGQGVPEPYVTPKVDPRFAAYDVPTSLAAAVGGKEETVRLRANADLIELLGGRGSKAARAVLQVGDELIRFEKSEVEGSEVLLEGCRRGYLLSSTESHPADAKTRLLFFAGYDNLFPGNHSMCHEVAETIGRRAREGEFGRVTLDGHESVLRTGLGTFSKNDTLKTIYDLNADREMIYTGSSITAYCWHMFAYMSWGEFDKAKGFRGTMLDYRIMRQVQLERNLMPHKLGQHYPNDAKDATDLNWLMGQSLGWNAGVEFDVHVREFEKRRDAGKLKAVIRKWEKVRRSGTMTEAQKLKLCQIDRSYAVEKSGAGWKLVPLEKRWVDPRCEILDASVIGLENLAGDLEPRPCSIDLSWTHNPLIYEEAALSDDIPLKAGVENKWRATYPEVGANRSDINGNRLKFVLRVPADAPCGIRDPVFSIDGAQWFSLPVVLNPGESLAIPLNAPVAFVYDASGEPVRRVEPSYASAFPEMRGRVSFVLTCSFESEKNGKRPEALMNLFYSATLDVKNYGSIGPADTGGELAAR